MLLYSVADMPYLATRAITPTEPLADWGREYATQMYPIGLYSLCPLAVAGSIALAIALWKSATVPAWAAACVGTGSGVLIAAILERGLVALPFMLVGLIGAVPVARALLARRD